jgi:primosomal protein N' (replication factor Y)
MPATERATAPLLIEPGESRRAMIATVAPIAPIDKTYAYYVPDTFLERVVPGVRVSVRMGERGTPKPAFCISVSEGPWETTLRPVEGVLDERPLLGPRLLALGQWMSRYYACPPGHTLEAMVPGGRRHGAGGRAVQYARLLSSESEGLTRAQSAALEALARGGGEMRVSELLAAADCGRGVLRALVEKSRVTIEARREVGEPTLPAGEAAEPTFQLSDEQRQAVSRLAGAVSAEAFRVFVLFGVTGSGKTEIYVRTIRAALARGRQSVMLVPEIALTTQTVQRLARRFERVAVLHSRMTDAQRARVWSAIEGGRIDVVIGTRSAVFAPCPRLGLIVVDEESEPSFKNQASPRYHTRDVAIKRAQIESVPIVLGSAAPALETWHNARMQRHYEVIRLRRRVGDVPMPLVHVVDMHAEHRARRGIHLLSRAMEQHLSSTLGRREQAILLLNRRGYASYLFCPRCNTPIVCPNCSVRMVFHAGDSASDREKPDRALCHYCRERLVVPNRCAMAGCGGTLVRFGMGTQRVMQELREKFPAARVERFDSDAMRRAEDYADALGRFESRKFDVLVGTQMVAKGLDFPFVSFVGIVCADTTLALPDFRAAERTFQLVLQVAGRSGRPTENGARQPGQVVVQTFSGDLSAIRRAVRHDYEGFAADELNNRRRVHLPPFSRLVRVVLSDARLSRLERAAGELARKSGEAMQKHGVRADVFPPQPTPIARIRNRYRYDVLLRFSNGSSLLAGLDALRAEKALAARVQSVVVDVDPIGLL